MSQRLHVGSTKQQWYDCVIECAADGVEEKLRQGWLVLDDGGWGPYKIRIGDIALYREIEPIIERIFAGLGKEYPDAIWQFYRGERNLEHPTRAELDAWLIH